MRLYDASFFSTEDREEVDYAFSDQRPQVSLLLY